MNRRVRYALSKPTPDQLGAVVEDLASWQQDGLPVQLHPGDLGWQWRFGVGALAEALRVWTVDNTTMAFFAACPTSPTSATRVDRVPAAELPKLISIERG